MGVGWKPPKNERKAICLSALRQFLASYGGFSTLLVALMDYDITASELDLVADAASYLEWTSSRFGIEPPIVVMIHFSLLLII